MPTQQRDQERADPEREEREQRGDRLGKNVLHALGQPGALHRVQVKQLWEHHYRVNVFVGVDAASAKVAHSYFLVTDGEGQILTSTPQIAREY
jgi:hypothetical protein